MSPLGLGLCLALSTPPPSPCDWGPAPSPQISLMTVTSYPNILVGSAFSFDASGLHSTVPHLGVGLYVFTCHLTQTVYTVTPNEPILPVRSYSSFIHSANSLSICSVPLDMRWGYCSGKRMTSLGRDFQPVWQSGEKPNSWLSQTRNWILALQLSWPWASHLASLYLHSLVCKIGIWIAPILQDFLISLISCSALPCSFLFFLVHITIQM